MGKKIGIDLGTTYSCVSYVDDMGVLRIVSNLEGQQTTPSVVFFDPNGSAVVGSTAKSEGGLNPECLAERVKNYMGNADYRFTANGSEYSATAVSALILRKLVEDAENAIGEEIEGAVITCPAYFGEEARNATKVAGENVTLKNGEPLKVLKILDEPTAAAIAYGDSKKEDMQKTILIYDLGGGTFDCTVMKLEFDGINRKMGVITTGGNHQLGGKDWDNALTQYVQQKFSEETGADISEMNDDVDLKAWFSENIEKAKQNLTSREVTSLTPTFNSSKARIEITREDFENVTSSLLDETILLVNDMLEKKKLNMATDIDEIILVGGSTKMPQVVQKLTNEYNKPISSFEPDKAVAMGAALLANNCVETEEIKVIDEIGYPVPPICDRGTLVGGTVIIENCTKSYGVRYFDENKQPKVVNLILKDTEKPNHGTTFDVFGDNLVFSTEPGMISQVGILVLENDSLEQIVSIDECQEIYLEEEIKLDGEVPGNNPIAIELFIDGDGILTLKLTDLVTKKEYKMNPRRNSDEANQVGLDEIKKMSLN